MAGIVLVTVVLVLVAHASTARSTLVWRNGTNPQALCNDFTQAGYFIDISTDLTNSDKWLIFLESGGLCYSKDTCNRRYFTREVRERFARPPGEATEFPPYGNFDPQEAWNATSQDDLSTVNVINPLMSSMECFVNRQEYFPSGLQVDGKDILDTDCDANPQFCTYNHVVLPYCSSDVWLGDETNGARNSSRSRRGACNCFDPNCFQFQPESADLQFTFRGKVIFESVIRELLDMGMRGASEVILAGSSAGGLGAVNLAKWTKEQLPSSTEFLVISDSAWFINFQGNILREFSGTVNQEAGSAAVLLPLLERHPACANTQLGYPCCLSAHCVLTERGNPNDSLLYYPEGVKTFGVFGLYDVFLLARSVSGLATVQDAQRTPVGFALDFLRTVGEYGGAMNQTLARASSKTPDLSYYVTECFQHIYLATSTLWGPGQLFGTSSVEVEREVASFSHQIRSGIWSSRNLATDKSLTVNQSTTPDTTIQRAILQWYENRNTTTFEFRDVCVGPYCNRQCPESFTLGELTSNNWPPWAKILIVSIVLGIAVFALLMKVVFVIWLYVLERKQDSYLDSLDNSDDVESSISDSHLQFPVCDEDQAVSVACLDLSYSVTFRVKKVKDEKKDNLTPVVLKNIPTEDYSEEEDEEGDIHVPLSRRSSSLGSGRYSRRRKKSLQRAPLLKQAVDKVRKSPRTMNEETSFTELTGERCSPSVSSTVSPSPAPLLPKPDAEIQTSLLGRRKLEILRGISMYFNPRQLIGIMGPSGCGKTTFLDLLTGRRKKGSFAGEIYVNGRPMDQVRDWYVANTGYVLQLATPYYEELTVRENLTLAAQIKLPNSYTTREKFKRVEQVMGVTGLTKLSDTLVGGATGPGLSGGQKRRLAIALQLLKLPSVIFLDEPTSGTVYFQQRNPLLVVSGFCVYSVASALFMFPALYLYYERALQVYTYEHEDGVGRAGDLVIQGFIRFITMAAIPVVICAGVLYFLLVNVDSYNFEVFGQVVIVNLALNQTWTALLISLICSFPIKAFRLSPIIASVAGFTSGFFIPINDIPWWYRWLSYINPNYYGFSSSAFLLLSDFNTNCQGTQFECYPRSGQYVLNQFNFNDVNPYLHITILLGFTLFYLFLATFGNWVRHTSILSTFKRVKSVINRKEAMVEEPPKEPLQDREGEAREGGHPNSQRDQELVAIHKKPSLNPVIPLSPILEENSQEKRRPPPITAGVKPTTTGVKARVHWRRAAEKSLQNGSIELESDEEEEMGSDAHRDSSERLDLPKKTPKHRSLFLKEGDGHIVWQPKNPTPQLYNVVADLMKKKKRAEKAAKLEPHEEKSLSERQRTLAYRIQATRAVLKEQNEELINEDVQPSEHKKHISLRDASKRISENLKKQKSVSTTRPEFSSIVSQYIHQQSEEYESNGAETPLSHTMGPSPRQRHPTLSTRNATTPGVMPIHKWRQLCRQNRDLQRAKTEHHFRNIPIFEERQHAPVNRTTSDPEMVRTRKTSTGVMALVTGESSERKGTAKLTESPQNARRRSTMQKQTHISVSTDSLVENTSSADTGTRDDVVRDETDSCGSPLRSRTPSPKPQNGVSKQPTKGVGMNGSLPTATGMNGSLSSLPSGFAMAQRFPSEDSLDKEAQQLTSPIDSEEKQSASAHTPDNPYRPPSSSSQKNSRTPTRDGSVSPARNPQTPSSTQATSQPNQERRSHPFLQAQANTSSDQM